MGSLRVGHDWVTSLSLFTFMHWRRKWQPTPVFLPGESQGREAWWAAVYGVSQSRTQLKRHSRSQVLVIQFLVLCTCLLRWFQWFPRCPGNMHDTWALCFAQNAAANQEDWVNFRFSKFWKIWASLVAQLVKKPHAVQEFSCNAGDPGSIPGLGRSPGDGNGNPLQYSCLGNPMDGGAWRATDHGAASVGHDLVTKLQI